MLQIIPTKPPSNTIALNDWQYNKNKILLCKVGVKHYFLCHQDGMGYIFKNVENQAFGANGWRENPRVLIKDLLDSNASVWEFDSIAEAMKHVDSDAAKV